MDMKMNNNLKKMRKLLDSISTITWLGMDICWMYDLYPGAMFFMFLTIIGLITHAAACEPLTKRDLPIHLTTFSWVMMNSMWMMGDYYSHIMFDILKTFFMFSGVSLILIMAYHDISKLRSIRKFDK